MIKNIHYFCVFSIILSLQILQIKTFHRIPLHRRTTVKTEENIQNNLITLFQPFNNNSNITKTSNKMIKNYGNLQYIGEIQIGDKLQGFNCDFDTGSSWLWIPGTQCVNCYQFATNLYSCNGTSAKCDVSKEETLIYGTGQGVAFHTKDKVTFGKGFSIENQDFLVLAYGKDFDTFLGDGICGLGFKTLSKGVPTFIDNLKSQGVISERKFSFYLSDYRLESSPLSELIVGGYDEKYMQEDFTYADVVDSQYWAVQVEGLKLGAEDIFLVRPSAIKAVIDSGTSLLYFDTFTLQSIISVLQSSGRSCGYDQSGQFILCDGCKGKGVPSSYPSLIIKFAGKEFTIDNDLWIIDTGSVCQLLIQSTPLTNSADKLWILGDIFMRKYYTIFNQDTMTIGFALASIQSNKKRLFIIIVFPIVILLLTICCGCYLYFRRKKQNRGRTLSSLVGEGITNDQSNQRPMKEILLTSTSEPEQQQQSSFIDYYSQKYQSQL